MSKSHPTPRHPYSFPDLIESMGKGILRITPKGDEKLVPAQNYKRNHSGPILQYAENPDASTHVMAYVQEFTGHLWLIDNDFVKFRDEVCPKEGEEIGNKDFENYLLALVKDSKSYYNSVIYAHFQGMWVNSLPTCSLSEEGTNSEVSEIREAIWIENLKKLRAEYSKYISKHMDELGNKTMDDYTYMKKTLKNVYGCSSWRDYLWQLATFDRLGEFISQYNKIIKKLMDAQKMYDELNQPYILQNIGGKKQPTVLLDGSTITIYCRMTEESDGKTYVYPDTPKHWCRDGVGINKDTDNSSIFPKSGMVCWLGNCGLKGLKVNVCAFMGHRTESNKNRDKQVNVPSDLVFCENLDDWCSRTGNFSNQRSL